MATLNGSVYKNGIENTFLDENKKYAICLLDDSNVKLATSAVIKYSDDTEDDGYVKNIISWSDSNKRLTFNTIEFSQTKSLVITNAEAVQFAIFEVTEISEERSEAYVGASTTYYWPEVYAEEPLAVGNLAITADISSNNNFRFDTITVNFSEADSL